MRVRQHLWLVLGGVFLLLCVGFVFAAYRFNWSSTGFLSKSLWDWLQLLIVPLALAIIALFFQRTNSRTEQQIALDKQREDLLQAYLDRMSELLLDKQLRTSKPDTEARNVARVRTISILFQLDARRIGYVFAFLREAGLMSNKPNSSIVSLSQADLRKINLSQANLGKANLSEADLSGALLVDADLSEAISYKANLWNANLRRAILVGAHLLEADLSGANLAQTDLSKAQSLKGATMPDGTIHP